MHPKNPIALLNIIIPLVESDAQSYAIYLGNLYYRFSSTYIAEQYGYKHRQSVNKVVNMVAYKLTYDNKTKEDIDNLIKSLGL